MYRKKNNIYFNIIFSYIIMNLYPDKFISNSIPHPAILYYFILL